MNETRKKFQRTQDGLVRLAKKLASKMAQVVDQILCLEKLGQKDSVSDVLTEVIAGLNRAVALTTVDSSDAVDGRMHEAVEVAVKCNETLISIRRNVGRHICQGMRERIGALDAVVYEQNKENIEFAFAKFEARVGAVRPDWQAILSARDMFEEFISKAEEESPDEVVHLALVPAKKPVRDNKSGDRRERDRQIRASMKNGGKACGKKQRSA